MAIVGNGFGTGYLVVVHKIILRCDGDDGKRIPVAACEIQDEGAPAVPAVITQAIAAAEINRNGFGSCQGVKGYGSAIAEDSSAVARAEAANGIGTACFVGNTGHVVYNGRSQGLICGGACITIGFFFFFLFAGSEKACKDNGENDNSEGDVFSFHKLSFLSGFWFL